MSLESAIQRMQEIRSMIEPGGSTVTATPPSAATSSSALAFSAMLASAQASGNDPSSQLPSNASASGLPLLNGASAYSSAYAPSPATSSDESTLSGSLAAAGMTPYLASPIGGVSFPWTGPGDAGRRMVALAQGEVGVREDGGVNNGQRIATYRSATAGAANSPGPWCAYFVSWLAKQSGAPIGPGGAGTGYVPALETWGRNTGRFSPGNTTPKPGDIVIFDWQGDGTADHTGIVERVDANGRIHTIEGNSSDSVARRDYAAGTGAIRGYVHPG
jgi:uncharacterized protein (TIGR02594 family)